MGFVFDSETTRSYFWWLRTSEGQNILEQQSRLIKRILKPQPGETILDVGCGPGFHLVRFLEWGLKPTGLDASPHMVDLARRQVCFKVPVFQEFAERLPFQDHHFDTVAFITSLEFMDSAEAALKEAFRTAKKKVLVLILNGYSLWAVSRHIQGLFSNSYYRHARFFNLWSLKKLIRRVTDMGQIHWGSVLNVPPVWGNHQRRTDSSFNSPFGAYLALSVNMAVPVHEKEWVFHPAVAGKTPSLVQRSSQVYP